MAYLSVGIKDQEYSHFNLELKASCSSMAMIKFSIDNF